MSEKAFIREYNKISVFPSSVHKCYLIYVCIETAGRIVTRSLRCGMTDVIPTNPFAPTVMWSRVNPLPATEPAWSRLPTERGSLHLEKGSPGKELKD